MFPLRFLRSSQVESFSKQLAHSSRARDKYLNMDLGIKLWALGAYRGKEDRYNFLPYWWSPLPANSVLPLVIFHWVNLCASRIQVCGYFLLILHIYSYYDLSINHSQMPRSPSRAKELLTCSFKLNLSITSSGALCDYNYFRCPFSVFP